ncbi:MAG: DNA-3-methyladenine glycosylase family protein [Christensenellales bacterium]
MKALRKKNIIEIESQNDFDIKQILECGQVFSFYKTDYGYVVVSMDKVAHIFCSGNTTRIKTKDVEYFWRYFDLDTDYGKIRGKIKEYYPQFDRFWQAGENIRILKQDAFQTIISFIVSANNNIARIKKILNSICKKFGSEIEDGVYSFPTLEQLSVATKEDFSQAGAGYRSEYLTKTIQCLQQEEFDISKMLQLSTKELRERLLLLPGVGGKVADCILFFGFGRSDSFPVDTWIRKAYSLFCSTPRNDKEISKYFLDIFREVSGYAQQYIFNFMINFREVA